MVIINENKLEIVVLLESSYLLKKYKSHITEKYIKEILNNLIHASNEENTSYNLSLISFHERLSPTLCPIKLVECGSNLNYFYQMLEKLSYDGTSSIHALTEAFKAAFSIINSNNIIDKKTNNRICILVCTEIPEDDPSLSLIRLNDLTLNKIFQKIKERNIIVNVVSPKRDESIKKFCEKVKMGPNDLKSYLYYNPSTSQDDRFVCFIQGTFISEKLVRGTSIGHQQHIFNNATLPHQHSQAADVSNAQGNDDSFIKQQHIPIPEANIQVKSEYSSPFQQSPAAIANPGSQNVSQYGQQQQTQSINAQFQSPQSNASPYAPQGMESGYRQQATPNPLPINTYQQPQTGPRSQVQSQQQQQQSYPPNANVQMQMDQSGVNRTPYQQAQAQQYPASIGTAAAPSPSYNPAVVVNVKQEFIQPEMAGGQQINQATAQTAYPQQQPNQSVAQARPLSGSTTLRVLWSGLLQWQEKQRPPDASNVNNPSNAPPPITTHSLMCRVSPMPGFEDLMTNTWPQNLLMQAIQQDIIHKLGHMFRNAKTLTLTFPNQEDTNSFLALNRLLTNNMAGCIMFPTTVPDIRVMILLYSVKKKSYIGLIPLDQGEFVNNIRKLLAAKREQQSSAQPGQQQAQTSQMPVNHQSYQQHSNMMDQQMQQSHQPSHNMSNPTLMQQQQQQQSGNMPQAGLPAYGASNQQSQMGNMLASSNYQQQQQQQQGAMGSGYGGALPNYNATRMSGQLSMGAPRSNMNMRQPGASMMYQNQQQQQGNMHPQAQQMNKSQLTQQPQAGSMYHQQPQHLSHTINPQQTNTQKLPVLPNIPSAGTNMRQSSNVQQGQMGSSSNQQQLRQLLMNPQAPTRNTMHLHANYQAGNPVINNPQTNQSYGGGLRMAGQHQNVPYQQQHQSAPRPSNPNQMYGTTPNLNVGGNFGQNQQQGSNSGLTGNLNQGGNGNAASNSQILDNLMDIIQ